MYFVKESFRQLLMDFKLIAIVAILIIDVIFAIPSIQWISKYAEFMNEFGSISDNLLLFIISWALALAAHVISSIFFILYAWKYEHKGAQIVEYTAALQEVEAEK